MTGIDDPAARLRTHLDVIETAAETDTCSHWTGYILADLTAKRAVIDAHTPEERTGYRTEERNLGEPETRPDGTVAQRVQRRRIPAPYRVCPSCCDTRCYEAPGDDHYGVSIAPCCETIPALLAVFDGPGRDWWRATP